MLKFSKFLISEKHKVRDISDIKTKEDSELYKDINSEIKKDFVIDCSLTKRILLSDRTIKVKWNDYASHSIKNRLKGRTTFRSISEFNDIFTKTIKTIIPKEFGKSIKYKGLYDLYLKENKVHILVLINWPFILQYNNIKVISVVQGTALYDFFIEIDDSYFNLPDEN